MIKVCFHNLFIYHLYDSKVKSSSFGGTEVQLSLLTRELAKSKDVSVSISTGDYGQKKVENIDNINIYKSTKTQKSLINYIKAPFLLWRTLKKINADVYITQNAGIDVGILSVFCKLNKKKFIYYTASDQDCNGEFIKKSGWVGKIYKYGLERADFVITQNTNNVKTLKELHNLDATIINNSFPIPEKPPTDEKTYLLWVGRAQPSKNLEDLFRIVEQFPNEQFIVIANKQGHLQEYFSEIKEKASTYKNVEFIDRVPFEKIQEYYNGAKLLICTSKWEGFPNVHLQACMGKTPVATLNINPNEYITKNNIGTYAGGELKVMLKQISEMLNDKELWEEKSQNAYNYMLENHDIKKITDTWEKTLQKIL